MTKILLDKKGLWRDKPHRCTLIYEDEMRSNNYMECYDKKKLIKSLQSAILICETWMIRPGLFNFPVNRAAHHQFLVNNECDHYYFD